jgi:hypothetical protein
VFGRAPRSSKSKKLTPRQKLSAKHNQLQQLHRGSAKKTVEHAPTPWFSWSTSGGTPPNPSFVELDKLPTTATGYTRKTVRSNFSSRHSSLTPQEPPPRARPRPLLLRSSRPAGEAVRPPATGEAAPIHVAAGGEAAHTPARPFLLSSGQRHPLRLPHGRRAPPRLLLFAGVPPCTSRVRLFHPSGVTPIPGRAPRGPLPRQSSDIGATTLLHYLTARSCPLVPALRHGRLSGCLEVVCIGRPRAPQTGSAKAGWRWQASAKA